MIPKSISYNKLFKYFCIFFFAAALITQVISPLIIEHVENTWPEKSNAITQKIAGDSYKILRDYESNLLNATLNIKKILKTNDSYLGNSQNEFLDYYKLNYPGYSFLVIDSYKQPALWFEKINGFDEVLSNYKPKQGFFYNSGIKLYLAESDSFNIQKKTFQIFLFAPVKKMYLMPESANDKYSLEEKLSKKFETKFTINLLNSTKINNGNEFYSYYFVNSYGKHIGVVSFDKPNIKKYENKLRKQLNVSRNLFMLLGFIFLAILLRKPLFQFDNKYFKSLLYLFLLFGFRILIYLIGFPSKILNSDLSNPVYFSSQFGFGIVKSPLEFFITAIFAVLIALIVLRHVYYFISHKEPLNKIKITLAFTIAALLPLLLIRAVGAMSKSVIADSSILYFSDFNLISTAPTMLMQINVLVAGFAFYVIIVSSYIYMLSLFKSIDMLSTKNFIITLIAFQVIGLLFHLLENHPLISIPVRVIILISLLFASYLVVTKKSFIPKLLLILALISSFSTSLMLNNFNSDQERNSLKNLTHDIASPKKNWYEYLIKQTLSSEELRKIALEGIKEKDKQKRNMAAFKIWSNSQLLFENTRAEVQLLDSNFQIKGIFNHGLAGNIETDIDRNIGGKVTSRLLKINNESIEVLTGMTPLSNKNELSGYLRIYLINEKNITKLNNVGGIFGSKKPLVNSEINDQNVNVYELYNNKLVNQYSKINFGSKNISKIISAKYNDLGEVWINDKLGNKYYTLFAYKPPQDNGKRIVVAGIKDKELSFGLFHFFKVFFIHSILIILIIIIYILFNIQRKEKIIWSFNSKLILSFLIVSIVPLILLAISIRELTVEKNDSAIFYKLEKRCRNIEKQLQTVDKSGNALNHRNIDDISINLNIKFTLFKDKKIIYSSYQQYYDIGLLPNIISSTAYYNLKNYGLKAYIEKQKIESHIFNSFFYKTNINGNEYVIGISDAFNPILLPMSGTELDIFLFGSYSFVVLLIIVFSTLLAKQISNPIRQLTLAAKSVAGGDLNLELPHSNKGEVKDLVNEFNYMVKELRSSQSALAETEREAAWKEMAKQVAHEVKNPLTPMKLSVQQLVIAYKEKSPKFDKIFQKVTQTLINQIEILRDIASEFSNFARMPNLKVERIDLLNVLSDVKNLFSEESISIKIDECKEKLFVNADFDQLKRTIINLVRNSIQAHSKNIILKINIEQTFVEIRISDDGHGITREKLSKVFDVDFTTKKHGMGLGLSIAKKFIENIGGEITVENTGSDGTTMLLKLKNIE